MYEYEEFVVKSYSVVGARYHSAVATSGTCRLKLCEDKAIRFLECDCSTKFGYLEEAYHFQNVDTPVTQIPSVYGCSLLLPILTEMKNLDPLVISTLERCLLNCRKECGFWNYFQDIPDISRILFPEDIDDTSLCLNALYQLGKLSLEECRKVAKSMIQHFNTPCMQGDEGEVATWFPPPPTVMTTSNGIDPNIILSKLWKPPRIDVGSTVNTLWFLASVDMEMELGVNRSVEYISKFLDRHIPHVGRVLPGMSYYTNRYVIYFLLGRYLEVSENGRKLMGQKFVNLIVGTLEDMTFEDSPHALDVACLTLAVMKMGLHKEGEAQKWGFKQDKPVTEIKKWIAELITKKMMSYQLKNGSFPPWNVFRWNKIGHFGGGYAFTTTFCLSALLTAKNEKLLIFDDEDECTK